MTYQTPIFTWPLHSDELTVGLANEAVQQEKWTEALTFHKMALDQVGQSNLEAAAMLHNNVGILYRFIGLNNLAMESLQRALELAAQLDSALSGIINYNAALLLFDESRWSEASRYISLSIRQLEKFGSQAELTRALDLGRSIEASANFTHSLLGQYKENVTSPSAQAERLREIASIYAEKGLLQEAIDSLNQAIDLCTVAGLYSLEPILLNDLAILYQDNDQQDAARLTFRKALDRALKSDNHVAEASIRNNLGLLSKNQGKLEDALEMFEKALAAKLGSSQSPRIGTILYNLAVTHLSMAHQEEALLYAQRALEADRANEPSRVSQDIELISRIKSQNNR